MIELPARQILTEHRDTLYKHLASIVGSASVHHVEDVVREIHIVNCKLRGYFVRDHQPIMHIVGNEKVEDGIATQNPFTINTISQQD